MLHSHTKWRNLIRMIHSTNSQCMTSTEVATALRPFYFAVHPDLFGQYPSQRNVNENSLKQLSSFLETLQTRRHAQPCRLEFYLRDKAIEEKGKFKLIKIFLSEREIRDVVSKVLKACNLPTEAVDRIPKMPTPSSTLPKFTYDFHQDYGEFDSIAVKRKIRDQQDSLKLVKWIADNYQDALKKTADIQPICDEINRLKTQLIDKWGLEEVRWDCGWNETHFRGCLQSFAALAETHETNMHVLRGRVLVFAPFTGVSLDGHIMLNSGEVRHNWLDLIKNVRKYDAHLLRIPAFEKAVSQVLRRVKVVRRKFMPKILAGEYERNLQQITTSMSDFLTYKSYPKTWPHSLDNYELVVETEAGPLMVSPTGQFIVPASCPGFLMVSFISENMEEATERIENYKRNKHVEKALHQACYEQLQLLNFTKDDNVNPDLMIKCCERLLESKQQLAQLKGIHLNIATYYSVLSDGVMCIPWNWNL